MKLQVGFELTYECPQPTPMMLMLNIHHTHAPDLVVPDLITTNPAIALNPYRDSFGNWCSRVVVPTGRTSITANAVVEVADTPEEHNVGDEQQQHAVETLPDECLVYLLGSRYCETDRLADTAWSLFGNAQTGAARVQAICDYVHNQIVFGYENARSTRTAWEAYYEGQGVCRDYAHLAIAFCRCMNIPARYCTGYLPDIGTAPPYGPMDFAAWIEAYVGGRWQVFDPRNNEARIGRVLIARGRDATDVAISNTFGINILAGFKVWADEHVGPIPDTASWSRSAGAH